MTDQQLRNELHRIAEGAPTAYVPADTFARGRRAHRRSVALLVGTVAGAVALVAGAIALAPTRNSADVDPARSRADLAVPDTIYATPTWLAESEDGRYSHADDLERDLAIGVGAIAYVQPAEDSNTGVAVVIDADDGDYHPLDLPDFIGLDPYWENGTGEGFGHRPLALSPDGRQLAWAWGTGRDAGTDSMVPGGVRVADLTTGEVIEWDLMTTWCPSASCDDRGTYVSDLEWSEGGQQLLWTGSRMDEWNYQAYVPDAPVAGVIHPASTSLTPYKGQIAALGDRSAWAVSDDGAIAFNGDLGPDIHLQAADSEPSPLTRPENASAGAPILLHGNELYISTDDGLARLDGTGSTYAAPNALPLQLLGWVGEAPLITSSSDTGDAYIGQLGTSKNARVLIAFDDVGHLAGTVSVAYALIEADGTNPTVHRGKPHFLPPWVKTAMPWLIVGGLALAIWWRRHRSSATADRRVRPSMRRGPSTVTVVAVVTLLVGLVAAVRIDPDAFTTGRNGPDDLDRLVAIPATYGADAASPSQAVIPREIRWADAPKKAVPVSDSLAVGRATLAFTDDSLLIADGGSVVVITEDGDYRRLRLPGVGEFWTALEEQSVELSPNGLLLAYVTENPGLNVLDLETGEVSEHALNIDGTVTSFAWSPSSEWLVWDSNYENRAAGRIAPDGTSTPLPSGNWANAGIGNDGTVAVRTESGTRMWPEGATDLPGTARESMSTWVGSGAPVDGIEDLGVRSIGLDSSLDVDLAIGRDPSIRGVDVDARSLVGVAGWMADGTPLIVTTGDDGNDLRTVFSDGGTEVIAHLDFPVTQLTIATALPADLPVTPPDPAWARTDPLPMILLIAGATGIAGLLVWRRIRHGRRDRRAGL